MRLVATFSLFSSCHDHFKLLPVFSSYVHINFFPRAVQPGLLAPPPEGAARSKEKKRDLAVVRFPLVPALGRSNSPLAVVPQTNARFCCEQVKRAGEIGGGELRASGVEIEILLVLDASSSPNLSQHLWHVCMSWWGSVATNLVHTF